jgi:hypothetical protein
MCASPPVLPPSNSSPPAPYIPVRAAGGCPPAPQPLLPVSPVTGDTGSSASLFQDCCSSCCSSLGSANSSGQLDATGSGPVDRQASQMPPCHVLHAGMAAGFSGICRLHSHTMIIGAMHAQIGPEHHTALLGEMRPGLSTSAGVCLMTEHWYHSWRGILGHAYSDR